MSSRSQRLGRGDRHRLLAGALHVEAGLALALRAEHAVVEGARQHHAAQHALDALDRQARVPRADRLALGIEHADQAERQIAQRRRVRVDRGTGHAARLGEDHVVERHGIARPEFRLGHMERQRPQIATRLIGHPYLLMVPRALRSERGDGLGRSPSERQRTWEEAS